MSAGKQGGADVVVIYSRVLQEGWEPSPEVPSSKF